MQPQLLKWDLDVTRYYAGEAVKGGLDIAAGSAEAALWGAGAILASIAVTAFPDLRRRRDFLLNNQEPQLSPAQSLGSLAMRARVAEHLPPALGRPALPAESRPALVEVDETFLVPV